MKWEKASPELGRLLEEAVANLHAEKKIMFGAPVYTVNRNMFTGVHASNIFLRLSDTDRQKIVIAYNETAPFEPVRGHVMKEYVTLPPALYGDRDAFQVWLRRRMSSQHHCSPKSPRPQVKLYGKRRLSDLNLQPLILIRRNIHRVSPFFS